MKRGLGQNTRLCGATLFTKEGKERRVQTLPSLEKRVPSADGGCFDDVQPQILEKLYAQETQIHTANPAADFIRSGFAYRFV
ncbi:MAG: hypothetical protein FWE59_07065, partial [Oscillospiraceae bacterium]|nr:hypothetical protein [Oscillospiraceae bacterium]